MATDIEQMRALAALVASRARRFYREASDLRRLARQLEAAVDELDTEEDTSDERTADSNAAPAEPVAV